MSDDFIAIAAFYAKVIFINRAGRALVGLSEDEDVSRYAIEDFLDADGARRSATVERPALLRDTHWSGTSTLRHVRSGELIPVAIRSYLLQDESGPMAFATVQHDLRLQLRHEQFSEQRFEEQRAIAQLATAELSEHLRELCAMASRLVCGVLRVDTFGIVRKAADAFDVMVQEPAESTAPRFGLPPGTRSHVVFLEAVAGVLAQAISHDDAEQALKYLALHDQLTGLPNRNLIRDRLEHALVMRPHTGQVALALFDLNGFKHVNDTFSHAAGDEVLVECARRLRASSNPDHTVGRLGGEEFALICEGQHAALDARQAAEQFAAACQAPIAIGGEIVTVALRLEITEAVLIEDLRSARSHLSDISALGVRLCLDDFGTGYSSLSYLQRLPEISMIKIDRSFVSGLRPERVDPIVVAIVTMAHALDKQVVAEGVEREEQRRALEHVACDFGQGHLGWAALPETALYELLAAPHHSM